MNLIVFQGHRSVKQFKLKMLCSYLIKMKLCTCSREIIDIFPCLKNIVGFFMDTIKAGPFKLCMIITLLGVYIVIVSLMTLALFQGHRCVKNINCKLHVLDSCPL